MEVLQILAFIGCGKVYLSRGEGHLGRSTDD